MTDADKLAVLRFQLLIAGRQMGKPLLTAATVKQQLQQFQNNPPQG